MKLLISVFLGSFLIMITFSMAHAKPLPLIMKKGMIISCPLTHMPIYKVVKTIREGTEIRSDQIIRVKDKKNPSPNNEFECDSIVVTPIGACIHTNKGWLPKVCQKYLRVKFERVILIGSPQ